jgi:hypothetical protein
LSRIFDALKRAQQSSPSHGAKKDASVPAAERRRSPRSKTYIPVFVYGHDASRQPFHEEAYSANVSDVGGLLVMTATVRPGQTLLLTNKVTQDARECRVMRLSGRDLQTIEVAVEFAAPTMDFWRVTPSLHSPGTTSTVPQRRKVRGKGQSGRVLEK